MAVELYCEVIGVRMGLVLSGFRIGSELGLK